MVDILFYIFAAIALGGSLGVVMGRNPITSLMFMVTSLASIAGIFVLLEAHFLAAIQIMVYAGAIMVLFLFVIMLLNLGHDYQLAVRGWGIMVSGFAVTGSLGGLLARQLKIGSQEFYKNPEAGMMIDADLLEHGAVGVIARPLFTDYVVAFELTGILLFVTIVGAIALAKKRV